MGSHNFLCKMKGTLDLNNFPKLWGLEAVTLGGLCCNVIFFQWRSFIGWNSKHEGGCLMTRRDEIKLCSFLSKRNIFVLSLECTCSVYNSIAEEESSYSQIPLILMSLAILFHLLCAQHVSDINISIFRSLRLCRWITSSVVLFSVRCVLEFLLRLIFGGVRFAGWSLQNEHHQISAATRTPTHSELRTRRPMW